MDDTASHRDDPSRFAEEGPRYLDASSRSCQVRAQASPKLSPTHGYTPRSEKDTEKLPRHVRISARHDSRNQNQKFCREPSADRCLPGRPRKRSPGRGSWAHRPTMGPSPCAPISIVHEVLVEVGRSHSPCRQLTCAAARDPGQLGVGASMSSFLCRLTPSPFSDIFSARPHFPAPDPDRGPPRAEPAR